MKYIKLAILLVTLSLCHFTTCCYADSISSEELIQNAKEYDGKEVVFQGEVIGDIMKRGNFCWVNISDGKSAIGVFLENSIIGDIKFRGDYDHIGDIVEARGIFHRSCIEHGGDLDIHASYMAKLKDGHKIIHKIDQKKVRAVLWLTGILFIVIMVAIITKMR